jgi:cytochrome P450
VTSDSNVPPGPGGPEMLRNIGLMRRHPPKFLAQCAERYGPVVRFPMPRSEVWFISDPEDVRRVLQGNHKAYGKRTIQYDTLALVTGTGLLASDAELWRRMRRVMSRGFHHDLIAAMASSVHGACTSWIDLRLGHRDEVELDLDAAMLELTLEIVAATLLGGTLAGRADQLVDAVMSALHVVVAKAQQPLPIPETWPTRGNRRLHASMRVLDGAVDAVIAARRAAAPGTDTLWLLISAQDEGLVTPSEVRDEVVTLIVAGHETVAATLTWTWVLLAQSPVAQRRVAAEVDALPDPGIAAWDAETLEQLPYTRAAVNECLRLFPPAWVITRRSLETDVLGGFDLPAGATVILSPYAMHRDERWWPEGARFRPERFLDGAVAGSGRGPLTYFPFGAGPRLCIGRDLALTEAPMVVATLARLLDVRPNRSVPLHEDFGVTLRPKGGLPAVVSRRYRCHA